jgi:hypothetical protein
LFPDSTTNPLTPTAVESESVKEGLDVKHVGEHGPKQKQKIEGIYPT